MKINKLLIVQLVFLVFGLSGIAQEANNLSTDQFYEGIEIDSICLSKIMQTHKIHGSLQTLFKSGDTKNTDSEGGPYNTLNYLLNGTLYSFEDLEDKNIPKSYDISYVGIGKNSTVILPDGIKFKIGDSFNILNKFKKLKPNEIVFIESQTNVGMHIKSIGGKISEIDITFF